MVNLRPYQEEAKTAIIDGWNEGTLKQLLVLPTGCGKTIVFAAVTADEVRAGRKVLILAHRAELLDQAADKLEKTTGLKTAREKAEETALGSWFRVTVGSVQTLQNPKRLEKFPADYWDTVIVDEAHHALSESYQRILEHFSGARVLGVTATPERGDHKNLGQYFEKIAYEYSLMDAIQQGYLCPIRAQTIPLKLDISGVAMQNGDYAASGLGSALDPYLDQIADQMKTYCEGRKTVVFLPLVATSQKFRDILISKGMRAAEVNGESEDRAEILNAFDRGEYDVLCNSMLLTEGWDCPSVDCIVMLRPTKMRGLYCQCIGRGTRLSPGKDHLLLLDFLWMTERHDLCRPACLICKDEAVAKKMTQKLEESGESEDLQDAEQEAEKDCIAERERALAEELKRMRHRKAQLVDPLQYAFSIMNQNLIDYQPTLGDDVKPPTDKQKQNLEKRGINPDEIKTSGEATAIMNALVDRSTKGLTTPKQIRFLEMRGFRNVGTWPFHTAKKLIDRIAGNNWKTPHDINPATFRPKEEDYQGTWGSRYPI